MKNYEIIDDPKILMAAEPMYNYGSYSAPTFPLSILNNIATKIPEYQLVSFDKMKILDDGLTKLNLEKLKKRAGLDYDKLAGALSVTRATLINNNGIEKYSNTVSERILALTDLYSYGYKVFENESNFNKWMFTENQALGNKIPFEIVDNQFGREEIKNLIGRIEYGVYS